MHACMHVRAPSCRSLCTAGIVRYIDRYIQVRARARAYTYIHIYLPCCGSTVRVDSRLRRRRAQWRGLHVYTCVWIYKLMHTTRVHMHVYRRTSISTYMVYTHACTCRSIDVYACMQRQRYRLGVYLTRALTQSVPSSQTRHAH